MKPHPLYEGALNRYRQQEMVGSTPYEFGGSGLEEGVAAAAVGDDIDFSGLVWVFLAGGADV